MDPRDRLFGELAVQLQFLTREQVGECVLAQHGEYSGRALAEIAISLGMLARDDAEALETQQAKLLEKRRSTIKRMPQVEEVVEQRAPKRDRRTDATMPMELAETKPGVEDYDFSAGPSSSGATIVGTGVPRKRPPAANSGQTMEQPSGAAARRAPADRAWRNPSRPPDDVPTGVAKAAANDGRYLDRVLGLAVESGASDVHAHAGAPLLARVDGLLLPLSGDAALSAAAAEQVITELMTDAQRHALAASGHARFGYEIARVARFRAHVYRTEHSLGAVFRVLPLPARSLEALGLPERLHSLLDPPRGLVLCAGPCGAGKTSTSAALVTALTEGLGVHAVYIDETGELELPVRHGAVTRVQVPAHAATFAAAIAQAQSVGARVIFAAALDDAASVFAALEAAAAGACVVACVPAADGAHAIERILSTVAATERMRAAALLAESLRLVTSQRMLVQAVGHGRVPAVEILVNHPQLAGLIRDDKLAQLPQALASGKLPGSTSLDEAIDALVRAGTVLAAEARKAASKKERFKA